MHICLLLSFGHSVTRVAMRSHETRAINNLRVFPIEFLKKSAIVHTHANSRKFVEYDMKVISSVVCTLTDDGSAETTIEKLW